jgi:hypothetical protein
MQDGVCPGEAGQVSSSDSPNQGWCQADVERAIAAAEAAELPSYRIEIGPDGTITIVVGE